MEKVSVPFFCVQWFCVERSTESQLSPRCQQIPAEKSIDHG
jgi:hypothetical protein